MKVSFLPFAGSLLILKKASAQRCTLCANGDRPDLLAITDAGVPCAVLAAGAGANDPPPDPDCLGLQFIGFTQCGCPSLPLPGGGGDCHVCGDDSISFNEEKELTAEQIPEEIPIPVPVRTCGEWNRLAELLGGTISEDCSLWEELAGFCECEGVPTQSPVDVPPTEPPMTQPTEAPVMPTTAPVTAAPVLSPTAPVVAPTAPTDAPITSPPVSAPTDSPMAPTTAMPVTDMPVTDMPTETSSGVLVLPISSLVSTSFAAVTAIFFLF